MQDYRQERRVLLQKLRPDIRNRYCSCDSAFYEKTLDHKKKKKVNAIARHMFSATVFNKGLLHYYRATSKLLFIFIKYGALPGSFEEKEAHRYKGRFAMFKKVMFSKAIEYETYKQEYESITSEDKLPANLEEAEGYLKEGKNIFQSLQVLEEGDICPAMKAEADALMKICVRLSLQVMKFKMNRQLAKGLKFVRSHPKYP